jgi:hypothetical protein
MRAVLTEMPGPRRWVLASIFPGQVRYFTRPQPGETPRTRFGLETAPAFGYRFGWQISKSLF